MTARVLGLDHVQLAMPAGGEAAADAFYAGVLELVPVSKPAPLAARGGRWFATVGGEVQVHLGVEEGFRPARKAHPAFVVDDLDELAARLAGAGHPVRPDHDLPGVRRAHVDDPFGNRVELIQAGGAGGIRRGARGQMRDGEDASTGS
ncbi:MAG: glyoxalase [Acidimicrobiia bacterium]|jgi:catechol 2,3-dioxygenase-like lactoylglutathione lyase family enzyme|nr:glyoxalase [Acidimicrobiia bacterium]